ncbi:unnamed protein product [Cuscuta campestris]|uniref:Uncharacterized protein n=1 Tax=Cuscuta campestris TaxID=132261 RepID=A0A484MW91_9ASTE|nr:unnamed protein product [Cuscuta campestris]
MENNEVLSLRKELLEFKAMVKARDKTILEELKMLRGHHGDGRFDNEDGGGASAVWLPVETDFCLQNLVIFRRKCFTCYNGNCKCGCKPTAMISIRRKRWEKEARDVQGADDQAMIVMLQAALPQGDVRKELRRNPLSTYQEMLARAKYLALEEEDDEPPVRKEKKSGQPKGRKRKDFVVIKVEINNVFVHRTLVVSGSSVNIMYNNTFKELGLSQGNLKPIRTPLLGFTGDTIEVERTITVKAGVGDGTHRLWLDMECMVGVARGNQSLSRSCYVRETQSQAQVDENMSTIYAAIQKEEGQPQAEPVEEVEEVILDPTKQEQKVKSPSTPEQKELMMKVPYASAIGSIMYAMICTRRDVSFALTVTSRYSRYQGSLGEAHWKYSGQGKDQLLMTTNGHAFPSMNSPSLFGMVPETGLAEGPLTHRWEDLPNAGWVVSQEPMVFALTTA